MDRKGKNFLEISGSWLDEVILKDLRDNSQEIVW